jgi:hypothetical protein
MLRALVAALLFAASAALAQGGLRTIPDAAARAILRHLNQQIVEVDGVQRELAPGAQIRDPQNRVVLPMTLVQPHVVKLIADPDGRIRQVWILTPQEAQQSQ